MKIKNILLVGGLLFGVQMYAQTYVMSGRSIMKINPAYTGIYDYGNVNLLSNNVDNGILKNVYVGYDARVEKLHGAVGGYVSYSDFLLGSWFYNTVGINYSYQGEVREKWHYSVGGAGAYSQMRFNSSLSSNSGKRDIRRFDVNLGGLIYSDKYFFSYAVNNLMGANGEDGFISSNYNFLRNSNIRVGRTFVVKNVKDLSFTASAYAKLSKYKKTRYDYLAVQGMVHYKMFYVGGKYSANNVSFQVGADIYMFRVTYGGNYVRSNFSLIENHYNTHEISLLLRINNLNAERRFKHILF